MWISTNPTPLYLYQLEGGGGGYPIKESWFISLLLYFYKGIPKLHVRGFCNMYKLYVVLTSSIILWNKFNFEKKLLSYHKLFL